MNLAADYVKQIEVELAESWLPRIYRERILTTRTRAYRFPNISRRARVDIQHTLLGIELKAGKKRMLCPDLATARYLAVFARAGCRSVAIPYDITKISPLADDLESAWHRMLLLADRLMQDRSEAFRTRVRRQLIGRVRDEIAKAGSGAPVPKFRHSTRERTQPQKGAKDTK